MCTAVCYRGDVPYFGRTLDLEYHYEEEVVLTPRLFPLSWRHRDTTTSHFAYAGMATMAEGYPLYYDGVNERGVAVAALQFTDFAHYEKAIRPDALCAFEVIPFLLSHATSASHGVSLLEGVSLVDTPFAPQLTTTPLHWLVSDMKESYVIEPRPEGLVILQNPLGVLANAPDFSTHLAYYESFRHLAPNDRSQSAHALPGNWTSKSRFVRAAYLNQHLEKGDHTTFFHMMSSLAVPPGASLTEDGAPIRTVYTSCCNLVTPTYHYITHRGLSIHTLTLQGQPLDTSHLIRNPLDPHPGDHLV